MYTMFVDNDTTRCHVEIPENIVRSFPIGQLMEIAKRELARHPRATKARMILAAMSVGGNPWIEVTEMDSQRY